MAKKPAQLSFVDIVMGAQADVIKEAYEARLKIDDLLEIREEAYRKIAEIEVEVEGIVGVEGEFVFPAPPMPIAGVNKPNDASRPRPPRRSASARSAKSDDESDESDDYDYDDDIEESGEESVGLPNTAESIDLDDSDDFTDDTDTDNSDAGDEEGGKDAVDK